jgi:tetratricopeptide (TPR) repeat protein
MKSSIFFAVFSIAVAPALLAAAAPFQDLDRINEIVNQARGLANLAGSEKSNQKENAPQNGNGPSTDQHPLANPFARGADSKTAGQPTNQPSVGIGSDGIQIDAGGRKFTIPRVGGSWEGNDIDPHMAAPAGNAAANYGSLLDRTGNATAALETANNYRVFAAATQLFRNADFSAALDTIEQVKPTDNTGPIEQFHALCRFANGDYAKSAELAYSALAKTPIYSWEQLRSYYGDPKSYAQQYQQLQGEVANHPSDPTMRFLLGYHHLMLGHRQHAAREFEFVLTQLPNDPITKNLLSISQQLPPSPMN